MKRFVFVVFLLFATLSYAQSNNFLKKGSIPVHVKADKFEAFNKKGLYIFYGNVVVERDGATLKADKIEIFKNKDYKDVSKIICTGHVVITKNDKEARADKAIYEIKDKRIILKGNAIVTSNKNEMSSNVIVYYIDKDYAVSQSFDSKKQVEVTIYPDIKEKK